MKWLGLGLIALASVTAAAHADAHFSLDYPKGRSFDIDKSPCGADGARTGTVTTLRSGDSVKLKWNVSVEHTMPGNWRISIDDAGQNFPDPVGAGDTSTLPLFMDHVEVSGLGDKETTITVPDIECDSCTLQLLQYKYPKPPYTDPSSFYFQCADIVISKTAPTGPSEGSSGSSSGNPPSASGSGGGGTKAESKSDSGGCSVAAPRGAHGNHAWLALGLLAFGWSRRRRQT